MTAGMSAYSAHGNDAMPDTGPGCFLDAMPASTVWIDPLGVILVANLAWREFAGADGLQWRQAGVGENYLAACLRVQGPDRPVALEAAHGLRCVLDGSVRESSLEYTCQVAGQQRWFRVFASKLGGGRGALVMHLDLTQTRLAERKVLRLNSLYAVASGINEAIVRIADEQSLFVQVCRIAVERDGLLMAWIGVVRPGCAHIAPVASWGKHDDFLETVMLTTAPGLPGGEGPAARAFRTGTCALGNDIASDGMFAGREQALSRGFASCAAFAIKVQAQPVGVIVLYAAEPGFFDDEKVNLINALAENLSFAVASRRDESRRRQLVKDLQRSQEELVAAAATLKSDSAEIARLNLHLEQRVAERTEALQQANSELEAFSYSIAHDLRSPLSSINGFSKLLERAMPSEAPEACQRYISRIRSGAVRMGEMIDALLSLAQLSRTGLRLEEVDLSALARTVLDALAEADPQREVRVKVEDGLRAVADPRLMRMMLDNLLGNAWKFTSKSPRATISFAQETSAIGQTVYVIRDSGIGFEMVHAGRLFGVFERLHGSADYAGTGIGLANVHRIVTRHRGSIWADAVLGEGATFRFTLRG